MVRTVDTDVVVILIGKLHCLLHANADADIWVAFGAGKHFTYWHINYAYNDLGEQKSLALPPFHSFTGCDTTSAFHGRGKKLAWEAWNCYPEVTTAFTYMASNPYASLVVLESPHYRLLERFTIVLYNKTSNLEDVDEANFVREVDPWRIFHLLEMLYCTMQRGQFTKQAFGLPVNKFNRIVPVQRPGVGSGIRIPSPGHQFGLSHQLLVKHVLELIKCSCRSTRGCGARCGCKKGQFYVY